MGDPFQKKIFSLFQPLSASFRLFQLSNPGYWDISSPLTAHSGQPSAPKQLANPLHCVPCPGGDPLAVIIEQDADLQEVGLYLHLALVSDLRSLERVL